MDEEAEPGRGESPNWLQIEAMVVEEVTRRSPSRYEVQAMVEEEVRRQVDRHWPSQAELDARADLYRKATLRERIGWRLDELNQWLDTPRGRFVPLLAIGGLLYLIFGR